MKNTFIRYSTHKKSLALPPKAAAKPVRVEVAVQENAETPTPPSGAFVQAHHEFLQRQATMYHYFLSYQQTLWQQTLQGLQKNIPAMDAQFVERPGPKFSRADLEVLAAGKISSCFGEWFEPLDQYERLIRMPEPPLLLADRVTGIDAVPGSFQRGVIWTETDVTQNAWYLHHGRMPAGIMVEAGQADLLLISWLGFDFHNRGERVYRLLGCDLSYHGELPKPGDTLRYEIHIDGHAKHGDIRLFFFHYDCHINGELRLQVRNGQAGFFSDQELAESGGVLWDAETAECDQQGPCDPPAVQCTNRTFDRKQLQAFSQGKITACFGPGFELTQTHTRTPHISGDNMLFIDHISDFDPRGGPLQRGYLRAVQNITPEDWFFQGHFKNDPCMPGTIMLEAGLQVMACYLTALGYTVHKDGWRFEPVPDQRYPLRCRGQVRPHSKQIVYEIFVTRVIASPIPTVYADLLATVDGLKAFHTHIGLRLIPDWPLTENHPLLQHYIAAKSVATAQGLQFDYPNLLACAIGDPLVAFGELYRDVPRYRRGPRLPSPPYHFMTRITHVHGEMGQFKEGDYIECEYDIPTDAWYFKENGYSVMPYCVLLEAGLQPCGWMAVFGGAHLTFDQELVFRNLDGTCTVTGELFPDSGVLRTRVKRGNTSFSAGMIIVSFDVESYLNEKLIQQMKTVFGFFPPSAFENQTGLSVPDHEQGALDEPSSYFVDLKTQPTDYFSGSLRLASTLLLMIDRITGFWPEGGINSLGRLRAEKDVSPDEWFFKAHFYQDPVQPGSIGIEAWIQLLQFYMLQQNMQQGIVNPRFEPLALGQALTWKYRGQIIPTNKCVMSLLDITEKGSDFVIATLSLWVDGKRIYEAKNMGMRIVSGGSFSLIRDQRMIDPTEQKWLNDHCPTYVLPTLPLMSMVDEMAAAAQKAFPGKKLIRMENIRVFRWVPITGATIIHSEVQSQALGKVEVSLSTSIGKSLSPFAQGIVYLADEYPQSPPAPQSLSDLQIAGDPYVNLFHGPAFQVARDWRMSSVGSSITLNAEIPAHYFGCMNQILLDAATHGIPHDNMHHWSAEISADKVAYPTQIVSLECFSDAPRLGDLQCEARFLGFHQGNQRFPTILMTVLQDNKTWLRFELVEVLFPKGSLGLVSAEKRRAFLQYKQYVPGVALATTRDDGQTRLSMKTVRDTDWLPGSIAAVYQVDGDLVTMTQHIAIKEHFGHRFKVHPSDILVIDSQHVSLKTQPEQVYSFTITREEETIVVV